MKIPHLDLQKFKEPQNQLKYVLPWSFIIQPGVCLLKNGAIMATYQVEYPDLESSSAPEIASMASLFNRTAMTLAQNEGWALFFDVKRYKTKDYPAGEFSNLTGWLIDQRRAENYHKFGEHFTTEYYITFVYQLPSGRWMTPASQCCAICRQRRRMPTDRVLSILVRARLSRPTSAGSTT